VMLGWRREGRPRDVGGITEISGRIQSREDKLGIDTEASGFKVQRCLVLRRSGV
jgi:hypothetical protein